MTRIGFISDLHLDVNKIADEEALMVLKTAITAKQLDVLVLAGDTYNDFRRTEALVTQLNQEQAVKILFLAGNHDMARGSDEVSIEEKHPHYLHKQWFDVANSDIRLIGHNGWYDYTWAPAVSTAEAWAFHQGAYFDRVVPQSETDIDRTDRALLEIRALFAQAMHEQKKIVFVTHFVPINDDLRQGADKRFGLIKAVMGSKRIGDMLQAQENVITVVFGHQHINPPVRYYADVPYVNVAVGIKKRRQEWLGNDLLSAIEEKMYIFSK